jgi:DNA-binding YbaB/EbfC family protein
MQEDMQKAQQEIANIEVEGQAGGGMVSVVMNGRHELRSVNIDESLMKDDKDMIEDLVAAAVNDAVRKIEQESSSKMSGVTSGLNLPAGMKLPF